MKIAVVGGTGGMGKNLIRFFKKEKIDVLAVGRKTRKPETILTQADIIFISIPSRSLPFAVSLLAPVDLSKKLIIGIGSCMVPDSKILRKIKGSMLHMHQLFGPKTFPFDGQRIIFARDTGHAHALFLKRLFRKNKVMMSEMTPKKHDRIMACTQALSQFSIIVLGDVLSHSGYSKKEMMDASTITFRMNAEIVKRIASQKADLWSYLQFENGHASKMLDQFMKTAERFRMFAKKKDTKAFAKAFDRMSLFWNN